MLWWAMHNLSRWDLSCFRLPMLVLWIGRIRIKYRSNWISFNAPQIFKKKFAGGRICSSSFFQKARPKSFLTNFFSKKVGIEPSKALSQQISQITINLRANVIVFWPVVCNLEFGITSRPFPRAFDLRKAYAKGLLSLSRLTVATRFQNSIPKLGTENWKRNFATPAWKCKSDLETPSLS